jgi:hypothetical protein
MAMDRKALWLQRRQETERLVQLRASRAKVCGCLRCGDADKAMEFDTLIRQSVTLLDAATNKLCERELVSTA